MFLRKTQKVIFSISRSLNMLGISLILVMTALIVTDVLLRWITNKPFDGSYELVELCMLLVVVFALSHTQVKHGHVKVTMMVESLPGIMQTILDRFASLLGLVIYGLITWQTINKGITEKAVNATTAVLHIPIYPFVFIAALGFSLYCLIFLVQIFFPNEEYY